MSIQDATALDEASPEPSVSDKGVVRGSIALAVIALLGFGLLYPLVGVGLGQVLFPDQANGSLLRRDGRVLGSSLVAQPFADARYFLPRPSAAGFDPMALAGSNQARTNSDLRKRIGEALARAAQREDVDPSLVPGDLVTQSGGGIDPHISPQAAAIQVVRVARARAIAPEVVQDLVDLHTQDRQLHLLGQPHVNVLELNLALDGMDASATRAPAARR